MSVLHGTASANLAKFVSKLERRSPLDAVERLALLGLPSSRRHHEANEQIVLHGEASTQSIMIESGFLSRTKIFLDGSRQVLAFGIPGDMVDLQSAMFEVADYGIYANIATTTVSVAHADILAIIDRFPMIGRAFWFDTLVDAGISLEWTANIGKRNARARTMHLLLECAARFDAIGALQDDTYRLPVTQEGLSEALGMSLVHVNRTIQIRIPPP